MHVADGDALHTVLSSTAFTKGESKPPPRAPRRQHDPAPIPSAEYQIFGKGRETRSLFHLVDPHAHAQRRRLWDRALAPAAVRGYQDALAQRVAQFSACLCARTAAPLDLGHWFSLLSYVPHPARLHTLARASLTPPRVQI